MAEPKTTRTDASVDAFLEAIGDVRRREDCRTVIELMRRVTGDPPAMWGGSIIGFGSYHYRYASGREGDWPVTGLSPRKQALTLYIMAGFDRYEELMSRLGKFKTGKSCLYIKSLADIDMSVLEELVRASAEHVERTQSGC
jgi:hypothetical protein